MARAKAVTLPGIARDIKVKDLFGLKGRGPEPIFNEQPLDEHRVSVLGNSLYWYNYFCTNKEAKQFIIEYLSSIGDSTRAKQLAKIADSKVLTTYGWLARLSLRGLVLNEVEKSHIDKELRRLFSLKDTAEPTEEVEPITEDATKKNIQEIMRERAAETAGELEGLLDEFIANGCKLSTDITSKVVSPLTEKKILPQHISIVTQPWDDYKAEFEELQQGKCEQLQEGYSHLTKIQVKHILKFIEQVTTAINSYVSLKKVNKTQRTRKPVPVEKVVSKLKYLRKFVDEKLKLNLTSIDPVNLHQCQEAWIYDTAKRKLYHFVADSLGKCLIVKGNTLLGFDTKESEAKILRKPEEQLKQVTGSKPAARKFFKEIKAVATTPNGRFNDAMIILKAF
jgi:hypothetical protein